MQTHGGRQLILCCSHFMLRFDFDGAHGIVEGAGQALHCARQLKPNYSSKCRRDVTFSFGHIK